MHGTSCWYTDGGAVGVLFVRNTFLPTRNVAGSTASLKTSVTAAVETTRPNGSGRGENSRPSTPGGPATGSFQPEPVTNALKLPPAATVIGLPSRFWTKFSSATPSPAILSWTRTTTCSPAGK